MARETCPCGAEVTTDRHPEPNSLVRGFRAAHAACRTPREAWQVCPVCGGCGTVAADFYTRFGSGTSTAREQCRRCSGTGTVLSLPPLLAVDDGGQPHGA